MIKCPICNKECKLIHGNHLKLHGMTIKEFKDKYPEFNCVSEESHKKLSQNASKNAKKGWETYKKKHNGDTSKRMEPLYSHNSDIEKRKKLSQTMKNKWNSEKGNILREKLLKMNCSDEHKNMLLNNTLNMQKHGTNIERIVENQLKLMSITFLKQHIIKNDDIITICDFFIPKYNLVIECNGDYWHCNPEKYTTGPINKTQENTIVKDKLKLEFYNSLNYNTVILWESEINDIGFNLKNHIEKYITKQ